MTIHDDDLEVIKSALRYVIEDLAERASFEEKRGDPDDEAQELRGTAERFAAVLGRLMPHAPI